MMTPFVLVCTKDGLTDQAGPLTQDANGLVRLSVSGPRRGWWGYSTSLGARMEWWRMSNTGQYVKYAENPVAPLRFWQVVSIGKDGPEFTAPLTRVRHTVAGVALDLQLDHGVIDATVTGVGEWGYHRRRSWSFAVVRESQARAFAAAVAKEAQSKAAK